VFQAEFFDFFMLCGIAPPRGGRYLVMAELGHPLFKTIGF